MKQIHTYGGTLVALLVIIPTTTITALAQMEETAGLSIISVNVSQDPIILGSDQEVSIAVVDNSSSVPAASVDVLLTVSNSSGMRKNFIQTTDQNGNADFVFPIDGNSKPGTLTLVAEIPGSNTSEKQSFDVIPTS